MNEQVKDHFRQAFKGRFESVLRWEQLDAFWEVLRDDAAGDWYIYAVGEPPPQQSASAELVLTFLSEIERLLRKEHEEDYCGVVFADSLESNCLAISSRSCWFMLRNSVPLKAVMVLLAVVMPNCSQLLVICCSTVYLS